MKWCFKQKILTQDAEKNQPLESKDVVKPIIAD
jgi:hypothetical protein